MIELLNENTTLLTPNRRLSASLLKKYNQTQIDAGKICWPSVTVLPITSWIQHLWHQYSAGKIEIEAPFLLTAPQELILWEEILQKIPANEALLQLSETAELAKTAWGILKQWRVDLSHPALATTDDSNTFSQWARYFQHKCIENNWLDMNSLMQLICEKIMAKEIQPPKRMITAGFTEFSPLQHYLFSCCEQIGSEVIHDTKAYYDNPITQRISLADEENEIRTMARWAKALMTEDLTRTIGCVVPNLEKKRDKVSAIFSEVFCEGQLYNLDCTRQPFNITAGKSLATYPIIHAALQLLNLNKPCLSSENMSSLLLSPFLGDAEYEQIKRAQFDARLRKANHADSSLKKLINTQEKLHLYISCPRLAKRLENFLALLNQQPTTLAISDWISVFIDALSLLGWPGERSINSQEYQVVQRWLELLDEYRTCDTLLAKKNYQNALHYLTRLTSNVVFQPQSTGAAVQILGVLEAISLPFDHTWVMGFDDSAWPPSAKPNPFIPHRLQATLNMPHSTAQHEFEYSKRLTEQLIECTQHIIFSHALQDAGCELRMSPLIRDLDEIVVEQLDLSSYLSLAELSRNSQLIETVQDTQAPAINSVENHTGGTSIFKLQAACPFKAFAEIRLHAKALESTTLGLKPQDRGKIVHKALELTWLKLKTSENLQTYSEMDLKNLLTPIVKQAIQLVTGHELIPSRYFSLEIERLQNLLFNWLMVEKSRPPFKVIAQEEERLISIANLSIKIRIDRIDELEDGSYLLIDYKTGKNNPLTYWFGDRLEEPQLPLYCVTADSAIVGIAFAEVHPDGLSLKGVSKKNIATDAIKPLSETNYSEGQSWEQQVQNWQHTLEKLGNEFVQGNAEVDPKSGIETCRYCKLQAFCRVADR